MLGLGLVFMNAGPSPRDNCPQFPAPLEAAASVAAEHGSKSNAPIPQYKEADPVVEQPRTDDVAPAERLATKATIAVAQPSRPAATSEPAPTPWLPLPEVAETPLDEQLVMAQLTEAANSSWFSEPTIATEVPGHPLAAEQVQEQWPSAASEARPLPTVTEAPAVKKKSTLPTASGQLPKANGKLPAPANAPAAAGMSLQEALKAARLAQR
jgi:hypothetical protein